MKFTFTENRVITWPVKVRVPVNNGRFQEQTFDLSFEILDQDEYDRICADNRDRPDLAILERVTKDWSITDEDDKPLPVAPETVSAVFAVPYVRLAAMQAYMTAVVGGRTKN